MPINSFDAYKVKDSNFTQDILNTREAATKPFMLFCYGFFSILIITMFYEGWKDEGGQVLC